MKDVPELLASVQLHAMERGPWCLLVFTVFQNFT